MHFLTKFYVAGDYMKSLNCRDYVKSLVTPIPCNILLQNKAVGLVQNRYKYWWLLFIIIDVFIIIDEHHQLELLPKKATFSRQQNETDIRESPQEA